MFSINFKNILGAVVSAVISAVVLYLSSINDIAQLDLHKVVSIALLVGLTSLLKNFATTEDGKFCAVMPIK